MIRELLAELDAGTAQLDLDALARRLGTSPAAVEGALELLVRKGRVVRDAAAAGACDGCAARSLCNPLMSRGTRYIPVPDGATVAPGCLADGEGGRAPAT
jgi:hypothetical protein